MPRHYCREIDRAIDALDMALDALNEARQGACNDKQHGDAAHLLDVYNQLISERRILCGIVQPARARPTPAPVKPARKPRARKAAP